MGRLEIRAAVAGLLLVVLPAGCGTSSNVNQSRPSEPAGAQTAPSQPGESDGAPPQSTEPRDGVPFNLSTHCGIEVTTFQGRLWEPASVEYGPSQPAEPFEPGTMHLEKPNRALFLGESGLRVDFRPAKEGTPTPLCS